MSSSPAPAEPLRDQGGVTPGAGDRPDDQGHERQQDRDGDGGQDDALHRRPPRQARDQREVGDDHDEGEHGQDGRHRHRLGTYAEIGVLEAFEGHDRQRRGEGPTQQSGHLVGSGREGEDQHGGRRDRRREQGQRDVHRRRSRCAPRVRARSSSSTTLRVSAASATTAMNGVSFHVYSAMIPQPKPSLTSSGKPCASEVSPTRLARAGDEPEGESSSPMQSAPTRCGIASVLWNSAVIAPRPPRRRTASASATPEDGRRRRRDHRDPQRDQQGLREGRVGEHRR